MKENKEQILCAAIWLQEVERAAHRPINTPGGLLLVDIDMVTVYRL